MASEDDPPARDSRLREARERVNRRMEAVSEELRSGEQGASIEHERVRLQFVGTDLPAQEIITSLEAEVMALLVRAVSNPNMDIQQLVLGIAMRELLCGYELGMLTAEARAAEA